uniref:Vesicle transport protein USE1 n=1 Tax=Sinocyclocheilus grahami TaxID=75366 RepID=A0A672Q8A1_SINGR
MPFFVALSLSLIFCVNVSLVSTVFRFFCCIFRSIPVDERQSAAELDAILQHHNNLQEKLADDMLNLARNLKNNTLAAQNIIKQDNQTLTQSMRQADMNFEKLKTESERLEQHAKKSVNWFLWLMLIVVSFTFISMILFIRLFPRLR